MHGSVKQAFESRGVINIKNFLSAIRVAEAVKFARQQFEHEGLWKDGNGYLIMMSLKNNRL
jgi:hypothetical protein